MKRSVFYFPILALFLAACAPQTPPSPALGEGTGVRETPPPVVSPPSPTVIPTQTQEPLSQEFIDVQEKFAETEIYTLAPYAIEMKQEDGTIKPIEGIVPNTKDGTFAITHEGEEFIVELESINERVITFKGVDGATWVWDGETLTKGVIFPPEMTDKYKNQFETFEYGIKQVNGVDTNVIYGIKSDETKKVIAMEIEIDGEMRMTRVGEYTDDAGFSYYTVILPEYSSEGRFSVTDKTSQILLGEPEGTKDANIWNSLAKQLGFATVAEARDFVMIKNGGKLRFKVACGERQGANTKSLMIDLPYTADFNLPMEIKTIITKAEFDEIPDEIKNNLSHTKWEMDNEEGFLKARLFWVKENGQIEIYIINTSIEVYNLLDPNMFSANTREYVNEDLRKLVAIEILTAVDLIDDGQRNNTTYDRQSKNLLEIDGLTFKGTSQ